jgi:hypothetical protein
MLELLTVTDPARSTIGPGPVAETPRHPVACVQLLSQAFFTRKRRPVND